MNWFAHVGLAVLCGILLGAGSAMFWGEVLRDSGTADCAPCLELRAERDRASLDADACAADLACDYKAADAKVEELQHRLDRVYSPTFPSIWFFFGIAMLVGGLAIEFYNVSMVSGRKSYTWVGGEA